MSTDQLADKLKSLGENLGLNPLMRLVLAEEAIKLFAEYVDNSPIFNRAVRDAELEDEARRECGERLTAIGDEFVEVFGD